MCCKKGCRIENLFKRDSVKGVFLYLLLIFQKYLLYTTPVSGCFHVLKTNINLIQANVLIWFTKTTLLHINYITSHSLFISKRAVTYASRIPVIKGTVIKIEKALINDRLRVSKVSWKFRIPTIYNFAVIYLWNLLFS